MAAGGSRSGSGGGGGGGASAVGSPAAGGSTAAEGGSGEGQPPPPAPAFNSKRCPVIENGKQCLQRVGPLSFSCQCGLNGLCAKHRYSDQVRGCCPPAHTHALLALFFCAPHPCATPCLTQKLMPPSPPPPLKHVQHKCGFDWKARAQELLAAQNKQVVAEKIQKL